jgi:probable HAF family extracellular repeat protein
MAIALAGHSAAYGPRAAHPGSPEYEIELLDSLGGTNSRANGITDRGWITGYSNLAGDGSRHAVLWRKGRLKDLETLGGPNSNVVFPMKSNRGIVVGIAQTDEPDPEQENWSCRDFFTGPNRTGFRCVGFVWEDEEMRPLKTLGGTHGFAAGANNRGDVVGWAETTVRDPDNCVLPQKFQFHAVIWRGGRGDPRQLPPYPGDTSSAATAINDRGQIVGISGICDQAVGRFTAKRAVIWEGGRVEALGDIGGPHWNTPTSISQRGDVVGFLSQPGDDPNNPQLRAFLWTRQRGIENLGVVPGDATSQAWGVNEDRQVVGSSIDGAGQSRAFLWTRELGIRALKDFAPDFAGRLVNAQDVDEHGRIVGRATEPATGAQVAFVATPVRRR